MNTLQQAISEEIQYTLSALNTDGRVEVVRTNPADRRRIYLSIWFDDKSIGNVTIYDEGHIRILGTDPNNSAVMVERRVLSDPGITKRIAEFYSRIIKGLE